MAASKRTARRYSDGTTFVGGTVYPSTRKGIGYIAVSSTDTVMVTMRDHAGQWALDHLTPDEADELAAALRHNARRARKRAAEFTEMVLVDVMTTADRP